MGKLFGTVTYSVMYTLTCEIYPTGLRSQGLSFHEFVASFISSFWPYYFRLGGLIMKGLPHLILCLWSLFFALLVQLVIPETLNKNLLESIDEALTL